jgi:LEA14-like dessication related protein
MHTTRLATLLALLTLTAAALTHVSCAAPSVNLKQADLKQVTTAALNLGLAFDITNPNQYTLPLKRLDWNIDLYQSPFTSGALNLGKQIGAGRTSRLDVPLAVKFPRTASAVQSILAGRPIPWAIGGKCHFETPIGPINVQFAKDGTWQNPIRDIKKLIGHQDALSIEEITPSSTPIHIAIELDPPA